MDSRDNNSTAPENTISTGINTLDNPVDNNEVAVAVLAQEGVGKTKKGPSEADKAAYIYKEAIPRALALASNMKAGELYRVFANYVQFPLVDYPKKLRSGKENELFSLLIQAAGAKNTLMQTFQTEIQQAEVEATLAASKDIQGDSNEPTNTKT